VILTVSPYSPLVYYTTGMANLKRNPLRISHTDFELRVFEPRMQRRNLGLK